MALKDILNNWTGKAKDKAIDAAMNVAEKATQSAIDTAVDVVTNTAQQAAQNIGKSFGNITQPNEPQANESQRLAYLRTLLQPKPQVQESQINNKPEPTYQETIVIEPSQNFNQPIQQPNYNQNPVNNFQNQNQFQQNQYPTYNPYYNPYYSYPYYQPAQLVVQNNYVKLTEEKLAARAKYEKNFILRVDKIVKGTIKFGGIKYFSKNFEADKNIVQNFKNIKNPTEADTRRKIQAEYRINKLSQIRELPDNHEEIQDFLYDAIYEDLRIKNEAGTLRNVNFWMLFAKENLMFAFQVLSPFENMQLFIDKLLDSDFVKNLGSDVAKELITNLAESVKN